MVIIGGEGRAGGRGRASARRVSVLWGSGGGSRRNVCPRSWIAAVRALAPRLPIAMPNNISNRQHTTQIANHDDDNNNGACAPGRGSPPLALRLPRAGQR